MKRHILLTGLLMLAVLVVCRARHIQSDSDPWEEDNANEISAEEKQQGGNRQLDQLFKVESFGHGLLNKPKKQASETEEKQKQNEQDGVMYRTMKVNIADFGSNEDASESNSKKDRTLEVVPEDEVILVDSNWDTKEDTLKAVNHHEGQHHQVPVVKESSQEEEESEVVGSDDRLIEEKIPVEKKEPVFTPYKYQRNWPMNIFADIRSYKKNLNRILGQSSVTKAPSEQKIDDDDDKQDKKDVEPKKDDDEDEADKTNEEHKEADDEEDDISTRGAQFFFGPQRVVFDTVHGYSYQNIANEDEPKPKITVEKIPINFSSRKEFSSSIHDMLQKILTKGKKIEASESKVSESPNKEEDNDEDISLMTPRQTHFKILLKGGGRGNLLSDGEVHLNRYPIYFKDLLSEGNMEVITPKPVVASGDESMEETTEYLGEDFITEISDDDSEHVSQKEVVEESVDEEPETVKTVDVVGGASTSSKLSITGPNDKSATIIESSFSPISFSNVLSNIESSLSDLLAKQRAAVLDKLESPQMQFHFVKKIVPEDASTNGTVERDDDRVIVTGTTEVKNSSSMPGGIPNFMKNIFGVILPKISTSVINFALHPSDQEGKDTEIVEEKVAPKGKIVMQYRSVLPGTEKQVFPSKLNPFRVDLGNVKIVQV